MRARCDEVGVEIPFVFHAGETLDHGGDTDANVMDAILLGTKRIGHGFSLSKHPVLIDICRTRKIAIELCPISNELLGLCKNIRAHPLGSLLAAGLSCTLSSDDPGFFQYALKFRLIPYRLTLGHRSTLSHEFYQVMISADKMSLTGWRMLIEWSLEFSLSTAEQKQQWKVEFRESWERYCESIVEKYG